MTEQPKTRLFAITIHAWRMSDSQSSEVNVQTFVALLTDAADVEQVANGQALAIFSGEEWREQKAIWAEIPPDSLVGPFRLRWQAERVDGDTTVGADS